MELAAYIEQELEANERDRMGYNILMLEHGLCKYSRLGMNKPPKKARAKGKKTAKAKTKTTKKKGKN